MSPDEPEVTRKPLVARVLTYLRDERERYPNGLTSAELAAAFGVKQGTIAAVLSDLADANCISRTLEESKHGRPTYRCTYASELPEGPLRREKPKVKRKRSARGRARVTDVLVLLAIGESESIQLTADQALDVYHQLHNFFRGRAQ
jgi:DNA-binding HxlR family transcriptional regulator